MLLDFILYYLQLLIGVLVAVAFLTLLERKVLSYTQLRKGPNKVGFIGVLQPFSDAIKLFSKEDAIPFKTNFLIYWIFPVFSLVLSLFLWLAVVNMSGFLDMGYSAVFFLSCASVAVYGTILSGWASVSKYSLLGAYRAIAQTISYEIVWAFIFLFLMFVFSSFSFYVFWASQNTTGSGLCFLSLLMIFFLICVVEANRAPFDLAEGESELVSGFNIEYGGLKFALIFLAEYCSIIWLCVVISLCFSMASLLITTAFLMILLFLYLRSSYPRIRYDIMMGLTWKKFLPLVLLFCMGGMLIF